MSNELTTISQLESDSERALAAFQNKGRLDPLIEQVRREVEGFVSDVTTDKGRKEIASMAFKVAKSRTAIEKVGAEVAARAKELPKLIDAERKRIKEALQKIQDDVRQPLTEWEALESEKEANFKQIIQTIKDNVIEFSNEQVDYLLIDAYHNELSCQNPDMQNYQDEYDGVKELALSKLGGFSLKIKADLAQKAELEKLRAEAAARAEADRIAQIEKNAAERAEREARERADQEIIKLQLEAEKAKREAVEAKQREIDLAQKAEMEAKAKAAQAEKDKQDAVNQEIERQKREQEAKAKELRDQEALLKKQQENIRHQKTINNSALADLVKFGLDEAQGKLLIAAIQKGEISHISIKYWSRHLYKQD